MLLIGLTLKDFQAHEKLEVKFSPGITTIRGASDVGKSSILRALRWLCLNDFGGDEFIREGAKQAEVVLVAKEGVAKATFTRKKGQGENSYLLNNQEFKAFGQSVPAPIAQLLSLSEINFQSQHDAPFWFAETAGEVSRRLNAVIDLSVIDTALSNISSTVRRAQDRLDLSKERLTKAELELEELNWQRQRVEEFSRLQEIAVRKYNRTKKCLSLSLLVSKVDANDATELRLQVGAGAIVLNCGRDALRLEKSIEVLKEIIEGIDENLDCPFPPDFQPVETAFNNWKGNMEEACLLTNYLQRTEERLLAANKASADFQKLVKHFHEKTKGQICPMCNQLIK